MGSVGMPSKAQRHKKPSKKAVVEGANPSSLKSLSLVSSPIEYRAKAHAIGFPARRRKDDLFPANDTYGLRLLYASPDPAVDIIFIHGLTGDSYTTWLDAKSGVYWPVDLLSRDIPDVRILTFGYDADVTKPLGPVGQNDLRDHALCLVHEVAARRNEDNADRKIIIIAHSLGGLVAKNALLLSEQQSEPRLKQLHQWVTAVAFIGTPHRGSDVAKFPTYLANILKASGKRVNKEILKLLQRDSKVLLDMEHSFATWLKRKNDRFDLTCFFEELELPAVGMVVKEGSAMIGGWPHLPIHANHKGMTKFSSREDAGYKRVRGELKRWLSWVENSAEIILSQDEKDCLQSLSFTEMNSRGNEIQHATPGTCKWLLRNETYMNWVSKRRGLLWMKGKPGAGKSTIMKSCLETLDHFEPESRDILTVSFFFHARGSDLQKTPEGLFRSVLHQLLEHFPKSLSTVVQAFRSRCRSMGKVGEKWNWHPKELERFIASCVPVILKTSAIRIFVDALDECGGETAAELVSSFETLYRACSSAAHPLSICFSCRHYPIIAPEGWLQICVETNNYDDIGQYVSQSLQEVASEPVQFGDLQHQIESRSNGVFLWAVLVTRLIISEYREGKTPRQLEEVLLKVPQTLDDLFHDIIGKLPEKDRSRSLKLFQWICFSKRPLNVSELRSAMNVDANPSYHSFRECETSAEFIYTDDQMTRQLNSLSCGLAEIQQREIVQLIHESVRDYLLTRGFRNFDNTMMSKDIIAGMSHIRLFRSCVAYFSMDEIKEDMKWGMYTETYYKDKDRAQAMRLALVDKYILCVYAVEFWMVHVQAAEKLGFLRGDLLDALQEPSQETMRLWYTLDSLLDLHYTHEYPWTHSWTMLHVAAVYNLQSVIVTILQKSETIDADPNSTDGMGRTPLASAADCGNEETVMLLLKYGAEVNSRDNLGMTPLHLAASSGHKEMAKLLLERGAEHDAKDLNGRTPLSVGAQRGQKALIELLVSRGAQYDSKDESERNPLSYAAESGREAIVKLLLAYGSQLDSKDITGRSPLLYAAKSKSANVVELLLMHGAQPDLADVNGRTPLSHAMELPNFTSRYREDRKLMDLLLAPRLVKGILGGIPSYAAKWGDKRIIKLLLEHGAQPDSKDETQRTPLFYGAKSWYIDHSAEEFCEPAVKLLLEYGAQPDSKDNYGQSPLSVAETRRLTVLTELLRSHMKSS